MGAHLQSGYVGYSLIAIFKVISYSMIRYLHFEDRASPSWILQTYNSNYKIIYVLQTILLVENSLSV